jgi:hypothetical protein
MDGNRIATPFIANLGALFVLKRTIPQSNKAAESIHGSIPWCFSQITNLCSLKSNWYKEDIIRLIRSPSHLKRTQMHVS